MGDARPPTLETGRELDTYRIVRRIGVGGMGSVYEAEHTGLGRRVALKALNPDVAEDAGARARFLREAQAVSRVRHPNIVGVSHLGECQGTTYLVMDLLEGEDLARRIARDGSLAADAAVDIALAVVSAIDAAHQAGVIHRDLKPANVFLSRTPRGEVPMVLDFGVSKVTDAVGDATRSAALLGSPHYMSPEQVRSSKRVDWRTDQYAIGVMLYECLTGRRPFGGATIFELVYAITHEDPPSPCELAPSVDPALGAAVMRAMARDPAARHPSMRALARSLIPFASAAGRARWQAEFEGGAAVSAPRRHVAAVVLAVSLGCAALGAAIALRKPPRRPAAPPGSSATPSAPDAPTADARPRPLRREDIPGDAGPSDAAVTAADGEAPRARARTPHEGGRRRAAPGARTDDDFRLR